MILFLCVAVGVSYLALGHGLGEPLNPAEPISLLTVPSDLGMSVLGNSIRPGMEHGVDDGNSLAIPAVQAHTVDTSVTSALSGGKSWKHQRTCPLRLSTAINDFASDVFKALSKDSNQNVFFSPLSVSVALLMALNGARGNTASQMEKTMHLQNNLLTDASLMSLSEELVKILSSISNAKHYKLLLANKMYLQKDFQPDPEYVENILMLYRSSVDNLDFAGDSKGSLKIINQWVAEETQGTIPSLFGTQLSPWTRLLLISAIYFKGGWKVPFPKNKTIITEFHLLDGTSKKTRMMVLNRKSFRYLDDKQRGYQFLELPYEGGDVFMLLALPRQTRSPDLRMTSDLLCSFNSLDKTMMEDIMLPRFRIEYQTELKEVLMTLGMTDLFEVGRANLTGINRRAGLVVDSVIHKAVVDVSEEGTEAAAATAARVFLRSGLAEPGPDPLPSFIADHPFMFYIIDKTNGLIMFTGKVTDPLF